MADDAKDGDRFDFKKGKMSKIEEKMTETRREKARDKNESHKEKSGNDCVGKGRPRREAEIQTLKRESCEKKRKRTKR